MTPDRWKQVSRLYEAARVRPVSERAAFLVAACGSDSRLRREVQSLLDQPTSPAALEHLTPSIVEQAMGEASHSPLTGQRVGDYLVGERLDSGGMGDVYRARDTRLGRDVAMKVLQPAFARDADRLARFEREARLLAALDHPHIGTIYGVEETDPSTSSGQAVKALVLALVEGETLAERIAHRAIPLDEALEYARQIAAALEAAHDKGIVHRDLKPGNIKITPAGIVKVLDFGLASGAADGTALADAAGPPTAPGGLTRTGVVMGTAAYMSPEQARGERVDKRTDIWAFGCVLYEMLTGHPAFARETAAETVAAILDQEPDWAVLPAETTAAVRMVLERCLRKSPKERLRDIGDVQLALTGALTPPAFLPPASLPAVFSRRLRWRRAGLVMASVVAGALVTAAAFRFSEAPENQVPVVVHIPIGVAAAWGSAPGVHFAVTPTGRTVVFANGGILYRRDLDRVDPVPIPGTQGGSDVFFSPDGHTLGFETSSELWTVSFDGATPQRLLPNQPLRGGTWGENGTIIVGRVGSGLWQASAAGGEPRQLTVPEPGERHELPQMLPGGRAVLFTIFASTRPPRAAVYLLGGGETRSLFEGAGARFVRSGHLVFGRQERLWAVGFDPSSLRTVGPAYPVRDDVLWSAAGYPQFTVEGDALAYVRANQRSGGLGKSVLTWMDREGHRDTIPLDPNNLHLPRLSPTGDRVAVQIGASRDLWTYDFRRGVLTKLTSDRIIAYSAPAWTPDGSRVAFTTWFDGAVGLGVVRADGSGTVEELIRDVGMRSFESTHPTILPDGSGMILGGLAPGATAWELLFVPLAGAKRLETLFHAVGVERNPAVAPSGRFIAYDSDESSRPEVYVRPFPNTGSVKWQISTDGGFHPVWTRDGREIVYVDGQGYIVAVAVRSEANDMFDYSKPVRLFRFTRGGSPGGDRGWDVTADGARFLRVTAASNDVEEGAETGAPEFVLIQNWSEELKARAPSK
jgi:serine/threonine-protein kinase